MNGKGKKIDYEEVGFKIFCGIVTIIVYAILTKVGFDNGISIVGGMFVGAMLYGYIFLWNKPKKN